MNSNEITEGNKLIAEFDGYPKGLNPDYILKYHTSWDWLMPVVEKIESITFNEDREIKHIWVHIMNKACWIEKGSDKIVMVCYEYYNPMTKIVATYKAVVEFIKWHNAQSKPL